MRRSRARRAMIPVLGRRDVRHPPIVAVPAVETIHAECPEAGVGVADDDQAVRVPDLHAEGALHDARAFPLREATESRLVLALAGVIPPDRRSACRRTCCGSRPSPRGTGGATGV